MARSVLGAALPGPPSRVVDARLLGGAAVFGVGSGLVGLCPGAVVPALAFGGWPVLMFFSALAAGLLLAERLERRRAAPQPG